ncbi:hypothetical protein ACFL6S_36480 [Candidatus Poribacteria bacterium]
MKRIFVLSISLIFVFTFQAFACFNPTDTFATEVVLNKLSASYDLELVKQAANVSFEEGAFVYRSHFDKRVAAVLQEIDESEPAEMLKGLSVKIQIPTKRVEPDDLVEAVDIARDDFDFRSAMRTELDWLATNGIINGVDEGDFTDIAEVTEAGLAGWNARIVYDKGKWLPYNETDNPMLFRDADCGGFDPEKLPWNDETIILPGPSSVNPGGKLSTKWGKLKARS